MASARVQRMIVIDGVRVNAICETPIRIRDEIIAIGFEIALEDSSLAEPNTTEDGE